MNWFNKIKVVLGRILTAFLVLILGMNLYTIWQRNVKGEMNPKVFGYSTAVVLSGSMEPEISVNDMVIVKEMDEYDTGDVIMFRKDGSLVTHRIVQVTDLGLLTRGDANNTLDEGVLDPGNVEGKVVAVIGGIGVVIGFFQTTLGMCSLVLVIFLFLLVYVADRKVFREKE